MGNNGQVSFPDFQGSLPAQIRVPVLVADPLQTPQPQPTNSTQILVPFACEEKLLGDITLPPMVIQSLFTDYVLNYHPLVPVVDVSRGPERIYRLCPALFWVIMFVSLRRLDDDKKLLLSLLPLVKDILAEITILPITRYNPSEEDEPIMNACSVYSVQAFILYTLWPPLASSLSADSSWNSIGVALFQAIRIGLHSLVLPHDGTSTPSQVSLAREQYRTWTVCNVVSQNVASAFGFPAFVLFNFLATETNSLSRDICRLMEIAHFEEQVAGTLGKLGETSERLSLIKVLLKQLDDLEGKVDGSESPYLQFQSILSRVHLLTYYFFDLLVIPNLELSMGLVRLYNAAILLISHAETCVALNPNFVKFLPIVAVLGIWQASCIIVKLAHLPLKSVVDVAAGRLLYTSAISLVAKALILKYDIAYRASGIMRNMWQLFRTLDEKTETSMAIKTKSRMSASVFFDCLALLRDQVGMAKLNFKTEQGTDENDEDDDDDDENEIYNDEEAVDDRNLPFSETAIGSAGTSTATGDQGSQKSTPGSTSSSAKRRRRLLGVENAGSKARRIIRTIPLDPQPIAASKRSTIFKVVNAPPENNSEGHLNLSWMVQNSLNEVSPSQRAANLNTHAVRTSEAFSGLEDTSSLDNGLFGVNNDTLWKDVDSLMNDFGFHT